jgi:hypothetical protein
VTLESGSSLYHTFVLPARHPQPPIRKQLKQLRYEVAAALGVFSASGPLEPIYDANGTSALLIRPLRSYSRAGRAVVPWHVMITTYSYFEADTGSLDRSFLRSIPFDVLALDEAHNIKNASSSRHR